MKSPYAHADKQLVSLKKQISAEFHNTANVMNFDELNVAQAKDLTKDLFDHLRTESKAGFQEIVRKAYYDAYIEAGGKADDYEVGAVGIIALLLGDYNRVTGYKYLSESRRKQERLMEGLLSAADREGARTALNRTAKLWFEQVRQYADFAVDEGRMEAFKDAGVKKVRWVAEKDEKTCADCKELDGQIFEIDAVPQIPLHRHCRCYLVPVRE